MAQELDQVLQSGIDEKKVSEAVQFFEDAMLLRQVRPQELQLKRQPHAPRVCVCDHFVRNAFLQEHVPIDPHELATGRASLRGLAGHLVESILGYYFMSVPGLDVAWFPQRTREPEVDLVLTVGTNRIPIEVKYRRGPVKDADSRGLLSYCRKNAYGASFGLVVTQQATGEISDAVVAVPASHLLLLR